MAAVQDGTASTRADRRIMADWTQRGIVARAESLANSHHVPLPCGVLLRGHGRPAHDASWFRSAASGDGIPFTVRARAAPSIAAYPAVVTLTMAPDLH